MQETPTKTVSSVTGAPSIKGASGGGGSGDAVIVISGNYDQLQAIAGHMGQVLSLLGLDLEDESIRETPMRVAKMLQSFNQDFDPKSLLKVFHTKGEESAASGIVAQSGIPFQMLCEHHLLPATGIANIAYLPGKGKVVGLSKLSRLVRAVGQRRPGLQETMTKEIADLIHTHLEAAGVFVVIAAEHTCMTCRGAHAPGVKTMTSVVKGIFRDVPSARQEAIEMFKLGNNS